MGPAPKVPLPQHIRPIRRPVALPYHGVWVPSPAPAPPRVSTLKRLETSSFDFKCAGLDCPHTSRWAVHPCSNMVDIADHAVTAGYGSIIVLDEPTARGPHCKFSGSLAAAAASTEMTPSSPIASPGAATMPPTTLPMSADGSAAGPSVRPTFAQVTRSLAATIHSGFIRRGPPVRSPLPKNIAQRAPLPPPPRLAPGTAAGAPCPSYRYASCSQPASAHLGADAAMSAAVILVTLHLARVG